jgi:DNA helicase-2/ATP-dependent DNA helicase PcrA
LLAGLNAAQRRAVTTTEGPLLVLAGAGTGKTRVVTVRIAYLLACGVSASAVLAVTFTNKAAREMRERLGALVGRGAAAELTVGTFHAFCARSLREHGAAVGLPPGFSICDAADQLATVRSALRDLSVPGARLEPSRALARISLQKNRLVTAEQALADADDDAAVLLARVHARYDELLRRGGALDFDDLLLFTRRLLAEHPETRAAFRRRYRHLLVDEYQDTNAVQYEIVHLIGREHRNVCVVGDDDQSIYGWRGADVARILNFEADFPGATVVRLETNYRSTGPILAAANAVIRHNPRRHGKTLRAAVPGGHSPLVVRLEDEAEEAEYVVRDLLARLGRGDVRPGDVGVLYRTQQQPRPLESALRAARVPYVLVGGLSFFDRKEVRDVLAYVRLLCHPDDEASLLRVVNRPARGVGAASVAAAQALATERSLGLAAAFDAAAREGLLPAAAAAGLSDLRDALSRHARPPDGRGLVPHLASLLAAVGYRAEVERCYPDERTRADRWAGVLEVLDLAENYAGRVARPTLVDFLERLALAAGDDATPERPEQRAAVTLMTLHAAKGLEFPHVYLVGAEEGLLPHQRAVDEETVEEERRLMYVGITRARERLTITWAGSRSRWGRRAESMPSRFLYELADETPPASWRPAAPRESEPPAATQASRATTPDKARSARATPSRTSRRTSGMTSGNPSGRTSGKARGEATCGAPREQDREAPRAAPRRKPRRK